LAGAERAEKGSLSGGQVAGFDVKILREDPQAEAAGRGESDERDSMCDVLVQRAMETGGRRPEKEEKAAEPG